MQVIKILTPIHTMPNVKSVITDFFDSLLPVLRNKIKVKMLWLVYTPNKLNLLQKMYPDEIIIDIHDYKNAIELLKKEKPDIIFAESDWGFIDYAISLAGKFLNIPVVSGFQNMSFIIKRTQSTLIKLSFSRFFESSVPTDVNQKKFMRRGRFFIYKYFFLVKTQLAINWSILKIMRSFFFILRSALTQKTIFLDSRFANDLHWLEGEDAVGQLINAGFKKSSIVVTGNPQYDGIFQKIQNWQTPMKKDNLIHVLFAPATLYEHGFWTKEQQEFVIKEITSKICQHKNDMSLTIKIHPSTAVYSNYETLIHSIDPDIPIYQEGDFLDLLMSSDVIISFVSASSAQIYALIAKKPIIICNPYNPEGDLFLERDLALYCKDPSEIVKLIKQIMISNPATATKSDDFIRNFLYKSDGHAAERLSDEIIKLIEKK